MPPKIAIIGGGIVALATAYALRRRLPDASLVIIEKEPILAAHQTGHNSGVIHSGIYYQPGSLKARLCVEGRRRMLQFCQQHGVPVQPVGKVIVATRPEQIPRLDELHDRAVANGTRIRRIDPAELRDIEPNAAGVAALHSPDTAIVDYTLVCGQLRRLLEHHGVSILLATKVLSLKDAGAGPAVEIGTSQGTLAANRIINCAGLHCDVIARMMGLNPGLRIIPFRGEYYLFRPQRRDLVRGLIYPVPDPALPFLGVHFTRTVHGDVEAGPNAVLAFAREGYAMTTLNLGDLAGTLAYGGFWKMATKYWRTGIYEFYRSLSKAVFVRALQELMPSVTGADLIPGPSGVRAQAVSNTGQLLADFRFLGTPTSLHVLNAPSPAATASLAIGDHIADEAVRTFAMV